MNVRHQRNRNVRQLCLNLCNRLGCLQIRHRTPDDVTACFGKPPNLRHCRRHVVCFRVGHRLNQNRISAADHPVPNVYYFCFIPIHTFLLIEFAFPLSDTQLPGIAWENTVLMYKNPRNIVVQYKDHQHHQRHKPDKMHQAFLVG